MKGFLSKEFPRGATAGTAAQQHTGTGLIERHVGLTEISMLKLEAELNRQGIAVSINELARECVMSHNISLNYGGVTPSMAVFGVIPRPFYQDDSTGVTSVTGALQTDVTPLRRRFESGRCQSRRCSEQWLRTELLERTAPGHSRLL